jgi:hypothetical protein
MFTSSSFKVSDITSRSLSHFKLIFTQCERHSFSLLHMFHMYFKLIYPEINLIAYVFTYNVKMFFIAPE